MALHNDLGKEGEDIAIAFIKEKGGKIIARNYRYGKAEIDIIAQLDAFIVFVEVKTRSRAVHGYPEEAVTKAKMKLMIDAAENFLLSEKILLEARFDVISIIKKTKGCEVHHIADAFYDSAD